MLLVLVGCADDSGGGGGTCSENFVGSCAENDNSACSDTFGAGLDASKLQTDCEHDGKATWSTSKCNVGTSVGGCEREVSGTCAIVWLYPPLSSSQAMGVCAAPGVFVTP